MLKKILMYICTPKVSGTFAGVVELVDTLDLGSSAARCESSSLSARTKSRKFDFLLFLWLIFKFSS